MAFRCFSSDMSTGSSVWGPHAASSASHCPVLRYSVRYLVHTASVADVQTSALLGAAPPLPLLVCPSVWLVSVVSQCFHSVSLLHHSLLYNIVEVDVVCSTPPSVWEGGENHKEGHYSTCVGEGKVVSFRGFRGLGSFAAFLFAHVLSCGHAGPSPYADLEVSSCARR